MIGEMSALIELEIRIGLEQVHYAIKAILACESVWYGVVYRLHLSPIHVAELTLAKLRLIFMQKENGRETRIELRNAKL